MNFLDPFKCASPIGIYRRTIKEICNSPIKSADYYIEAIWNVYRPYLKCACKFLDANASSDFSIIWFDHAI